MTSVALFRNLNQGQRGNPTSAALSSAFIAAGAADVRLVRGNGTVLFTGPASATVRVVAELRASGWNDLVFVRDLEWMVERVRHVTTFEPRPEPTRIELTFFDEAVSAASPLTARRCVLLEGGPGYAVSLNLVDRTSDSTPMIEKALGVRATSRALATLAMLGAR